MKNAITEKRRTNRLQEKNDFENNQKNSCKFYNGGNRCGILKSDVKMICLYKKCTLYKNKRDE